MGKSVDYQILVTTLKYIEVEIEWKHKYHFSYWYSINGHEVSNFCQGTWSVDKFKSDLC